MVVIDPEVERVEEMAETELGVEGDGVVVVETATNEAGRVLSDGSIGTAVGSTILRLGTEVIKVPSISNESDIGGARRSDNLLRGVRLLFWWVYPVCVRACVCLCAGCSHRVSASSRTTRLVVRSRRCRFTINASSSLSSRRKKRKRGEACNAHSESSENSTKK